MPVKELLHKFGVKQGARNEINACFLSDFWAGDQQHACKERILRLIGIKNAYFTRCFFDVRSFTCASL